MRNSIRLWILMVIFLFAIQPNVFAAGKPIQKGEPFPAFKLPMPKDADQKKYLGLSDGESFRIQDIKAEVVIIQIFHSG